MFLILNCGSQSIKLKLFNRKLECQMEKEIDVFDFKNYKKILAEELKEIGKNSEIINTVGHRVVHGGGVFTKPIKIDKNNLSLLKKFNKLAPLHNPYNISGIEISRKVFPKAQQFAVFDTEFFSGLPLKVVIYPLPEKIRKKYGIRKFGFHGISHEYAAREGARAMGYEFEKIKIITCHLGGGVSIAAIDKGRAVDTSMGFTPMDGAVMMTRPGSIDPGIIFYLNKPNREMQNIFNHKSGVSGICGLSDMKEVLAQVEKGNKKASLALEIFVYSIKKYIGAYFAILRGCDVLVFTGAIGYGSGKISSMIYKDMEILKKTKIVFVKPNEELAIAQSLTSHTF